LLSRCFFSAVINAQRGTGQIHLRFLDYFFSLLLIFEPVLPVTPKKAEQVGKNLFAVTALFQKVNKSITDRFLGVSLRNLCGLFRFFN